MNFLYFSTLAWDEAGGAHNPTQIARALARQGHTVLFVEPQPSANRTPREPNANVIALTELGMTPLQLRRAWFGLDSGDPDGMAQALIERIAFWNSNTPRVAVFSAPFDPFVRLVPFLRARQFGIVYYAMDDFAAAPALGYTQFAARAEDYLVRNADACFAVTPHAAKSLERFGKRASVIPNGVEHGVWRYTGSTAHSLNIQRGELTLGFWGTLMESMFDADLVEHAASTHPRWMIHLLGAIDPEPHRPPIEARLKKLPNVFFHGPVPHADLLRYAAAFDVALAPFPDNDFTRGRDPIKVYEYLAAHLPVVASYAPQLAALPAVFVANSPAEFVLAIEEAARTRIDARALDVFIAQQSWDARAEQLSGLLRDLPPAARDHPDAAILPSFANPDAAAIMRYADMLERELEQVQAWAREMEQNAQARGPVERVRRFMPSLGRK